MFKRRDELPEDHRRENGVDEGSTLTT